MKFECNFFSQAFDRIITGGKSFQIWLDYNVHLLDPGDLCLKNHMKMTQRWSYLNK